MTHDRPATEDTLRRRPMLARSAKDAGGLLRGVIRADRAQSRESNSSAASAPSPLDAVLAFVQASNPAPPGSRYHGIATATARLDDGRVITHLRRRILPQPPAETIAALRVSDGDRPDLIAARLFGDGAQWWRLCDLSGTMDAGELVAARGDGTPTIVRLDASSTGRHEGVSHG